ncbi:hypothetical protein D3C85_223640 [compost metagenome]
MKVNIAISPLENILAAINAANTASSTNITSAQVTAAAPVVAAGTAGRNTTVELTGVDGQGIEGSRVFAYTRQSLATGAVASTAPASVTVLQADDQAASVTKVATALGLVASEFDASAYTAPEDQSTPGTVTITAKATSLLYVGVRVVPLNFADADVAFATVAPITDLDAFEAEE